MTSQPSLANTARLLIACPDQPGIVSAVSTFLYHHGANIIDLDQHSSATEGGNFFMRLEFHTPHVDLSRDALAATFRNRVAEPYAMQWQISYADEPRRMAVLVSKHDHVLMELLWLARRGDLPAHASLVISNHETLRSQVNAFDIPFHHVPVTPESKAEAEQQILELLENQADVVVLARYMQILSGDFVERYRHRIINIHHSFLPAFAGANPYGQAYERGVKLIGATAHYVTEALDQGPIIEQQVMRVSHRHSADDLKGLGEEAERSVLCRAVKWHLQDRVIVDGNKTVVFTK